MGIIGSLGNAVFHCPIHSVLIIAAGGYIHKHAGLGVAVGFHKDDLDGMGSADILKGVGLHRADALAVDLDVGDSIALIRGDGEGLIPALADADIAGGSNGAASPGSCLDGVVAVRMAAAIITPVCRIGSVASAARGDGDGHIVLAVKPRAAPAGEGVTGACGGIEGDGIRFNGIGIRVPGRCTVVQVVGNGVQIERPLRRDGQVFGGHGGGNFRVPAHKRVAVLGGIGGGGDGRAVILRDGGNNTASGSIKGDRVLIDLPLCPVFLIAHFCTADRRNRRAGQIFVVIPALEGVPGARHICRECCAHAVGVFGDIAVVDRAAVRVQRDGVGICFPLRPIFLVARFGVADCRNRKAGQAFVVIPSLERISRIGHIVGCRKRCTHAVGVSGDIAAVDRAAVCVQRDGVGICFPLRPILFITRFCTADCRNRIAGQAFVIIPALEGVPGARHICRECCAHAVGIACDILPVCDRAAVRIQGYGVGRGCPLHSQFRHLSRNNGTGRVELAVAAKPHEVAACISGRTGQAVGCRRGKLAAVFHDDVNSIGAAAQLAAVQVKGNDLQSVRIQCVSVQDFKHGTETDEQEGVRSIVAAPVAGRTVPANRTDRRISMVVLSKGILT